MSNIKTDRDAFNYVKNHLLNQGFKSMNEDEDCQYRGYNSFEVEKIKLEYSEQIREVANSDSYDLDEYWEYINNKMHDLQPVGMCAVGCLIKDEDYDPSLEGKCVEESVIEVVKNSNPDWEITETSISLLDGLQVIHDRIPVFNWKEALEDLESFFSENGEFDSLNYSIKKRRDFGVEAREYTIGAKTK